MKRVQWIKNYILMVLWLSITTLSYAGSPVWTFTPLTATTISVSTADTATIQYQVTNQSRRTHTLELRGIPGISQNTTSGNCANSFTLGYQQSCRLTLTVDGATLQRNVVGGPVVCQQGNALQCYQPSMADALNITLTAAPGVTTLSASVSTLALSVNDTSLNAALTGTPRQITITNTGSNAATGVTYSPSPALPSGTTITPSSCGTIVASGTCVLTITPGSTPSAAAGNTSPTPITLSISGTNTNTLTPTVNILTYGSVYQGGYVYAVDDTTPDTGSIGGKVVTLTDQATPFAPGIIWSANGVGGTSNISIYGISETSTTATPNPNPGGAPQPVTGQTACKGNTDGSCNSNNIYVYYQPPTTSPGINTSLYATGLCKATINGYSDWYLPAICEMGFSTGASTGCGTQGSPTLQNIQSNLVDNGDIGGLLGFYWSSTESSGSPSNIAWYEDFGPGSSDQGGNSKSGSIGVRCSRALTH